MFFSSLYENSNSQRYGSQRSGDSKFVSSSFIVKLFSQQYRLGVQATEGARIKKVALKRRLRNVGS
jgi:hypothetical protein